MGFHTSSSLYGHQKGYINNYTNSHHVHSVASSQYAHYQVHPDISVTAQQKVHHRNNNSLRTCSEGSSKFFFENIIILSSSQRPLYEVDRY